MRAQTRIKQLVEGYKDLSMLSVQMPMGVSALAEGHPARDESSILSKFGASSFSTDDVYALLGDLRLSKSEIDWKVKSVSSQPTLSTSFWLMNPSEPQVGLIVRIYQEGC